MSNEKGNDMTPEEINKEIDEIRGYYHAYGERVTIVPDRYGDADIESHEPIPDYYHSLDACAEFTNNGMTYEQAEVYENHLELTVIGHDADKDSPPPRLFSIITATAPQRCEAFLRMHNKWRE